MLPSLLRTVIMPLLGSTLTTCPSIFVGAFVLGPAASPRGEGAGWQFGLVLSWASAGPPAISAAATTAAVSVNIFMAASLFFGDVVDRAGGGAHTGADQRAFARAVAGARADRGAGAGT